MLRRSVCLLVTIAVFASINATALVSAQTDPELSGSALVVELTADVQRRMALESVSSFDDAGGWAVIGHDTITPELFFYLGTDPVTQELTGVNRVMAAPHPAGRFVAVLEPSQLVAQLDPTAGVGVMSMTTELDSLESIVLTSAAGFDPQGGVALADPYGTDPTLFSYSSATDTSLAGIQAPDVGSVTVSSSVVAVDPASIFPLVIDPPPVTLYAPDPDPVTVDPPPVGGQDLGSLIPDPPPVTVDPPPVGGQNLGAVIPDPPPVTVDPPQVGGQNLAPLIPDPPAVTVDPPPVGGQNLAPLIPDPPPTTVDPPPVGGQNLAPLIPDPPPVTVDPPPVGPVTVSPLDPPPIAITGIDPAPVIVDPPPYAIKGVDDPAPVVVDPPPYAINGVDPAPIYLDPPATTVPGADPAPVTYDPAPVSVNFPDPPPVGGTYVNPPDPGTISYDPPAAGGTYVNPPTLDSMTVDPAPVGGGQLYIPDSNEICADASEIVAIVERVLNEIGTIDLPPLPPLAMSSTVICFDPSDGAYVAIPAVDAPPVTVAVPTPCPGGCYVMKVDPDPVSVTVPNPCSGTGCYVPLVDQPAPAPIYLDAGPVSVDPPPMGPKTIDPAPFFADPAPVPGATGDPAKVMIADPGPVPGATGDPAAMSVDPPPIAGVIVDPPPVCSGGADPFYVACTIPRVDAPPVTVDLPHPCSQLGSMACIVPRVDESPITIDPPHPCSQLGSMACIVPVVDEPPVTVDLPHPCSQLGSMVCTVPVVDEPPVTVDPPHPCGQVGSMACVVPVVDGPPVTVDLPGACSLAGGSGTSCTIDPSPVATINPSNPPPPPGACASSGSDSVAAAGSAEASTDSEASDLQLGVQADRLHWADVDADCYRLVDPYEKLFITTTETSFVHPALLTGDNFSVTVAAIRNGSVVAVERLRGSTIALKSDLGTPTVQDGLELLSAMMVRATPTSVEFVLPRPLVGVVDGWNLYRNESLIATAGLGVASLADTAPTTPPASSTYSVQLLAPDWRTSYEDPLGWVHASEMPCVADPEHCPSSPLDPSTTDGSSLDAAHEVNHVTSASEEDWVSGDLLTFAIPIEIPDLSDPLQLKFVVPPAANEDVSTLPSSGPNAWGCRDYWTSHCLDDSVLYHRTFIPEKYIDSPECCNPFGTNYAFGGDDRGFGDELTKSTRTRVTVRMDWEGVYTGAHPVTYIRDVSPTKRYIILPDGSKEHESTKTGYVNPTVQFIAHNTSRYRIRVRHSAKNPFESYYPAIDYEWESVVTRDGGVTTKGLHDGAPNYEDFYRAPFSNGVKRVYTHSHTSFISLAAPMDQKNRRWCSNGCPNFGTARWVD